MSDRILISAKKNRDPKWEEIYDAIFTEDSEIDELFKWTRYEDETNGAGPWRAHIADIEVWPRFFNCLQEFLKSENPAFEDLEDISMISFRQFCVYHPSLKELEEFIKKIETNTIYEDNTFTWGTPQK